jgi:hypothetical protein
MAKIMFKWDKTDSRNKIGKVVWANGKERTVIGSISKNSREYSTELYVAVNADINVYGNASTIIKQPIRKTGRTMWGFCLVFDSKATLKLKYKILAKYTAYLSEQLK